MRVSGTSAHEVKASTKRGVAPHEPWHAERQVRSRTSRIFVPGRSRAQDMVQRDAHIHTWSHGSSRRLSRRHTRSERRYPAPPEPQVVQMPTPASASEAPPSATGPLPVVHKGELCFCRISRAPQSGPAHGRGWRECARGCLSIALGNMGDGETGA